MAEEGLEIIYSSAARRSLLMQKRLWSELPCTLKVHRGNCAATTFEMGKLVFSCMSEEKMGGRLQEYSYRSWMAEHRLKQMKQSSPIQFPLPYPICVRTGEPVISLVGNDNLNIFSEYTNNDFTFDAGDVESQCFLVIDKNLQRYSLRDGLYKCSMLFDAPLDWWNSRQSRPRYMLDSESTAQTTLYLTLEEHVGPCLVLPKRQGALMDYMDSVPYSLSYYINDFKKTFNIK